LWAGVALPALLLAWAMRQLAVDLPYWDQWALVFRMDSLFGGRLALSDLLTPHHEHMMPVPLAVMFGLARWTHWNVAMESGVNFALALALFAVVAVSFQRMAARLQRSGSLLVLPVLSLLVFSITQHSNWMWGLQISALMGLLFALLGLSLLCEPEVGRVRFGLALMAACVASLSQAQGLLVWPLGLVALLLVHRAALLALSAWVAVGGSLSLYVFSQFTTQENARAFLQDPLALFQYCLTYLGSPVVHGSQAGALVAGALGLLVVAVLALKTRPLQTIAFPVVLALFSIAAALMTGIGRLDYGLEQALASRYISFSTPLWIALVSLLGLHVPSPSSRAWRRSVAPCGLVAVWLLVALSGLGSWPAARAHSDTLRAARQKILAARERIPEDPNRFAALLRDPALAQLLQGLQGGGQDLEAFQIEHAAEIDVLLASHGLDFIDAADLKGVGDSSLLVRFGLVVMKKYRLSLFREGAD